MVDPDRLDELTGGDDTGGGSTTDTNDTPARKTSSGTKTKREKLNEFKSNSTTSVEKGSGGEGTQDVKQLVFCLANMDAYARIVAEKEFDVFNQAESTIKDEFARDVSGEIVNFLGVFNVRDICDRYGYSWQNILETAIDRGDILGESMRTNSGDPDRDEIKDLLDCIANVLLFVEGNLRDKQQKENKKVRDSTIEVVSENVYDRYTTITSKTEVQNIAERYGYDWNEDIIQGVLSNQDFSSKLNE